MKSAVAVSHPLDLFVRLSPFLSKSIIKSDQELLTAFTVRHSSCLFDDENLSQSSLFAIFI
jgi:predicted RNase H-like nuclease